MKAYVVTPYSDSTGKHDVGEEVEFTPEEKEGVNTLINYGILSRSKPEPETASGQKQG